jgi:hypothetical protein
VPCSSRCGSRSQRKAHVHEALFSAAAHRKNVVGPGEDIDLADPHLAVDDLDHVQHREQRVAVFLDLRALMAVARVFDRKLVQVELVLHGCAALPGPGP